MNRIAHILLVLGSALLMVVLLFLVVGTQTPAHSAGSTIKVPGDYATIQTAIDAAVPGDTILVTQDTYHENLSITEGITLSGGWDETFTTRTPGQSFIDGQGLGRVISVTCATSDTVVTVDGFRIMNGDATGLGAPAIPESAVASALPGISGTPSTTQVVDPRSPSERAAELRDRLGGLAERGLYPGGSSAYQAILTRLERLTTKAEEARVAADSSHAADMPAGDPDSGGGIYSWNASLHLLNTTVEFNVASRDNDGYGGGIYMGQAALSGTLITNNVVQYNTASSSANGGGGGLYLLQAPGAVIEDNQFLENVASNAGLVGVGGGFYIDDSQDVLVHNNQVERNTAHASWDCPAMGGGGIGGGAQFRLSDDVILTNNVFRNNLAALHCGSHGGGLYMYRAENPRVADNQVIDNWGVLFQVYTDDFGGGMGLDTIGNPIVSGNVVRGNTTSMSSQPSGIQVSYGGGIFGYALSDSQITSNTISANLASVEMTGFGGGMYLVATDGAVLTDNTFSDNTASLSGEGSGGGLDLRNTVSTQVRHNRFQNNRGSAEASGYGGALDVESYGPHSFDTSVDTNLFLDNQASANPAANSSGGACQVVTHGFAFTNNVVAGNTADEGGGLSLDLLGQTETDVVTNNTFFSNGDTGVLVGPGSTPNLTLTNNIVVSHTVGISVTEGVSATVRYTLWDANSTDIAGGGVISHTHPVTGAPAFADSAGHDYHLIGSSAAIDSGDIAGVPPAPPQDLDGVTRPQNLRVDLGAYEWRGSRLFFPLMNKNWRAQIGWVVGASMGDGYGVILRTTDGGSTWIRQGVPGEIPDMDTECVAAIDAQNAWVVGGELDDGIILRTRDGGHTWQQQEIPEDAQGNELSGIFALDGDTAWAVGAEGVILHTTDGGLIWTQQGQGDFPEVQLDSVYASDTDNAWAIGNINNGDTIGTVLRTTDGGTTWNQVPYTLARTPCQTGLIDIHGVDANTVWVVGPCQVSLTTDGGETWIDQWKPDMAAEHINGVFALERCYIWLARDAGGIFLSTDGGENFIKQDAGVDDEIMRISSIDRQTAWAVTVQFAPPFEGNVLHTADGGQTWITQTTPVKTMWMWVSFVR